MVLAAGGWAFGALAEEVAEGDTGLDNRIADELHERDAPSDGVLRGRDDPRERHRRPAGVAAIAAYLLARRRYYAEAVLMVLAYVGAEVLQLLAEAGVPTRPALLHRPAGHRVDVFLSERARDGLGGGLWRPLPRPGPPADRPGAAGVPRRGHAGLTDRIQPPVPRRAFPLGRARWLPASDWPGSRYASSCSICTTDDDRAFKTSR